MISTISLSLTKAAQLLKGSLQGGDAVFQGVSTDTRLLRPGQLFIALVGQQLNGHDFLEQARKAGAAAAVVCQPYLGDLPVIQVANTLTALADLAAYYRRQLGLPVIAVTGSCGKTTTKNLLASILNTRYKALANESSFNNNIGLPLTLLNLTSEHEVVVTEMGANHAGEIAELTALAQPHIAVITNAAPVHLEGFGSIEGIAQAKGEIFQGLDDKGIAIINADDYFADFWRGLNTTHQVITFGIEKPADVRAVNILLNTDGKPHFTLQLPDNDQIEIALPLLGRHNVYNALAAASAAHAFGVKAQDIQQGLQIARPVAQRLVEFKGTKGALVIDDSYNANPTSVGAAIKVLVNRPGQPFLVLGDMLELGQTKNEFHRQVGEDARKAGVKRLYCYGELSQNAALAFGENACSFATHDALINALKADLNAEVTVLIKGSNSMCMYKVVQALKA